MKNTVKLILLNSLIAIALIFGFFPKTNAQNAPITTAASAGNTSPGQSVTIPVTVTNFNSIGSVSLTLDYDYSKLHFVSGSKNPLLPGSFDIGDNDLGNGMHRLVVGWYGQGTTLPDGSWIVNFYFTYISGTATLQWYDNGSSCEYADGNSNVLNDEPTNNYYINGAICGSLPAPGTISGNTSVCQGQTEVEYSIAPMSEVIGYYWTVPQGATIISGENTDTIVVNFSNNAISGNVSVCGVNDCGNGPSSALPLAVNVLPVADAGNDTTVFAGSSVILHAASGGTGAFSYHWYPEDQFIDPYVQNPQTVPLNSTMAFQLTVTNSQTSCQSNDNVTVFVSTLPLIANPTADPPEICRQQNAQLFANVVGGSENYSYSWTCLPAGNPAWSSNLANPVVSPDTTTLYLLSASDGTYTISASVNLTVNQLPTALVSGGDSICDDGSVANIRIDLTGTPPWQFVYSNGIDSTYIESQTTSPYQFTTSIQGTYTVTTLQDENCTGTADGIADVVVLPTPPAPIIYENENELFSDALSGNQWYKDDVAIDGATGQSYSPAEDGYYYDIATINGCKSDTSNIIHVIIDNIIQYGNNNIHIYPNPAKDYVSIQSSTSLSGIMKIAIYSYNGMMVKSFENTNKSSVGEYSIDIRNLSPGIYLLKINVNNKNAIYKLSIL